MFWGRDHRILRTLLAGGAFLVGLRYAAAVESGRECVVGLSRLDDAVFLHSFPVRLWISACGHWRTECAGGLVVARSAETPPMVRLAGGLLGCSSVVIGAVSPARRCRVRAGVPLTSACGAQVRRDLSRQGARQEVMR